MLKGTSFQAISSKDAAALDKDLMEIGGFSLDQLMELAGLSVSQAGKQSQGIRATNIPFLIRSIYLHCYGNPLIQGQCIASIPQAQGRTSLLSAAQETTV